MNLDRNVNRGGRGKYALVNMRKLIPLLGSLDPEAMAIKTAFNKLVEEGFITLGNESHGEQFFVMKYKDKFTADGLQGYASSVAEELKKMPAGPEKLSLSEYCAQMFDESHKARTIGNRIPD